MHPEFPMRKPPEGKYLSDYSLLAREGCLTKSLVEAV